jgi:hypothetical protein
MMCDCEEMTSKSKVFPTDQILHHGRYSTTEITFILAESQVKKKKKNLKIYLKRATELVKDTMAF